MDGGDYNISFAFLKKRGDNQTYIFHTGNLEDLVSPEEAHLIVPYSHGLVHFLL